MSRTVVSVENLSKRYRLGVIGGATFHEEFSRWWARRLGRPDPYAKIGEADHGNRKGDYLWALREINLDVKEGEVLGIIGRNGAGKSTLLKILSRITAPTAGRAVIRGRVGSLLEVGTGFHHELTGRENIYLNGTILGMTRAEVDGKLEEIIEFAEMSQFIDTPVKRYSSGMTVRLAFAIAAHLEPEILIIDEVLAVGDVAFQNKCLEKVNDVSNHGKAVIFVSHNMNSISRLCSRALVIDRGVCLSSGVTDDVISQYLISASLSGGKGSWLEKESEKEDRPFKFNGVRLLNNKGDVTDVFWSEHEIHVEIDYCVRKYLRHVRVGFVLRTTDGIILFETYDTDQNLSLNVRNIGKYILKCAMPANLLKKGQYALSLNAGRPNVENLAYHEDVVTFRVEEVKAVGGEMITIRRGLICPRLEWKTTILQGKEAQR